MEIMGKRIATEAERRRRKDWVCKERRYSRGGIVRGEKREGEKREERRRGGKGSFSAG